MISFTALGGDGRTEFMAQYLTDKGIKTAVSQNLNDINYCAAVILPLPYTVDGIRIKGTDIKTVDFLNQLGPDKTVFAGKADEYLKSMLKSKKIEFYDYNEREEFAQKNALPTAQGVLSFVIDNTDVILNTLTVAVTGYGKCGKSICRIFKNIGSEVLSFSRRYSTAADAESDGMKAYLIKDITNEIGRADIIINTVPAQILKSDFIDAFSKNAVLIETASSPYGFDIEYAQSRGKIINFLPSLPGKCVPKTAGIIIAETIINIIEEGGLWKKSS